MSFPNRIYKNVEGYKLQRQFENQREAIQDFEYQIHLQSKFQQQLSWQLEQERSAFQEVARRRNQGIIRSTKTFDDHMTNGSKMLEELRQMHENIRLGIESREREVRRVRDELNPYWKNYLGKNVSTDLHPAMNRDYQSSIPKLNEIKVYIQGWDVEWRRSAHNELFRRQIEYIQKLQANHDYQEQRQDYFKIQRSRMIDIGRR